ncbi:MAG: HD domain-containing protein, partial [Tepidimonas taiwanensis]|nr:HD domain-containing protein [Tepidimonas taiwanensis]
ALADQRRTLALCERQYAEGARRYRAVLDALEQDPLAAGEQARTGIDAIITAMDTQGESAIRLLGDVQGERGAQHAMNVTVLSLLLGRAMGLARPALQSLGVAALLHDIGKTRLPDIVRFKEDAFTPAQFKAYQEHVAHGVARPRGS